MVATLTFVVRESQELQELAKTTLRTLNALEKVTLKGQAIRENLLMISIPMYSSQTDVREMKKRHMYQMLKNILKLQ